MPPTTSDSRTLARGTFIVASLTLLSRFLGFIRDLLVARLFGAGFFADAFFVAFRIPNLLRSFVAEGALTSAFVPVFTASLAKGKDTARATLSSITGFLIVITSILTLAGIFFSPLIVALFAPGYRASNEKFDLCVLLTQIMMPYIMFVSLVAMLNAALNACYVFGASAWAQVIMNLALIFGAAIAFSVPPTTGTIILAVSVLVGGILQLWAQFPATRRVGLSLSPSTRIFTPEVRELLKLMTPALIGASIYQMSIFLATVFASLLQEGSISWLFYADRVAQLPIGIFSIALASVLLPSLARAHSLADQKSFEVNLMNSLRFTSFIVLPLSVGIAGLSLPIVELLFERGTFTNQSSIMTSRALTALCFGLWATSCHSMLVRSFVARKDTLTPTIIGLASLFVNVLVSIFLMGDPVSSESIFAKTVLSVRAAMGMIYPELPAIGHVGLALASSCAALTSLGLVIWIFCRKYRSVSWMPFAAATLKALVACIVMLVALELIISLGMSPMNTVLAGVVVGGLVYVATTYFIGTRELQETFSLVRRTIGR